MESLNDNTESTEETINRLKHAVEKANAAAKDYEDKMMKAALYGKDLLDKNIQLEHQIEADRQEKYELNMRLQAKQDLEKGLNSELDSYRELLKAAERSIETIKEEETERNNKREEELKLQLIESERELEAVVSREARLQELVETMEKQVEESKSALNKSVAGESFSTQCDTLQQDNVALLLEKQTLQLELSRSKDELETTRSRLSCMEARLEARSAELESIQCEMSGYISTIESQKMDMLALQAQLDAERAGNLEHDDKGNSLFREVEDRRQIVEQQLATLTVKFNTIKETYDLKVAELQKVRMHNSQLLSIAGSRKDTDYVDRLEDLLSKEKEKARVLMEKLETLDNLTTPSQINPGSNISPKHSEAPSDCPTNSTLDSCSTVETPQQELQSTEYKYMAELLRQANAKNTQLQEEMRKQIRQNVEESENQRELSRKLHYADQQIKKLKGDSYTLKMQLDQLKSNSVSKLKKETKKIVEQIKFDDVPKENTDANKLDFCVKETVLRTATTATKPALPDDVVDKPCSEPSNEKTGSSDNLEKKKRKGIVMCDMVEEIDQDGEIVKKDLVNEAKDKALMKKPKGGRKHTSQYVKAEQPEECKQQ